MQNLGIATHPTATGGMASAMPITLNIAGSHACGA